MDISKYKSVPKGAGKKVAEIFEKDRNKEPSDKLVQIISEVQPDSEQEQKEQPKKRDDRAARSPEV